MIEFRKKRELSEIITDSVQFLKQEYKPLSQLILRYVVPFLILYAVVQVNFQMKIFGSLDLSDPEALMENIGPFYLNIFLFSLFGIFIQSLLIGTFYSYLEVYIKKGKGNFELSEITPVLFSNGLIALGAGLVWFLISMIGLTLCLVPGFYFANTFSLVVFISLFERKGLSNAMSRSWNMVNSQWWNTLLLNIVAIVIVWVAGFVLSLPIVLAGTGNAVLGVAESGTIDQPQWYWVATGVISVISSLFWIVPYTFLAFQYFNIEERENPKINNDLDIPIS